MQGEKTNSVSDTTVVPEVCSARSMFQHVRPLAYPNSQEKNPVHPNRQVGFFVCLLVTVSKQTGPEAFIPSDG